ncbi:MAG: hypothetical protein RSP_05190 [Rhodanobacter sp.]
MKKTPAQIDMDKLESGLRKANNRVHKATEELDLARKATNANTKSGESAIKKREKALDKAMLTHFDMENASLQVKLQPGSVPPPKKRLGPDRL